MRKILLTILAGLLVSCGLTSTKQEEASSEASREEVNVAVNVDYAEKMGLALLLGQLPHVIDISGCISFNAGEKKTVQYLNVNDDLASTVVGIPEKIGAAQNETAAAATQDLVKGYINLYLGDTGCEADLMRFRHEGQWYEKSSSDQPPTNTGMVLYRAIDVPAKDSKEFWVQNLSDLDQIHKTTTLGDNQIKFAVWKSFERNQIESSINVNTEWDGQASTLDDRHLGRFDIAEITQTYNAGLRREVLTFNLNCGIHHNFTHGNNLTTPTASATGASWLKCNDSAAGASDTNSTAKAAGAGDDTLGEDTKFHIFLRDPSKTTFSIQEIIDNVANKTVGNNEELLSGSSLEATLAVDGDGAAVTIGGAGGSVDSSPLRCPATGCATATHDYWTATFDLPHSALSEGSNALVLVVEHLDPYAEDDLYSSSYRYHLINLDYHHLD